MNPRCRLPRQRHVKTVVSTHPATSFHVVIVPLHSDQHRQQILKGLKRAPRSVVPGVKAYANSSTKLCNVVKATLMLKDSFRRTRLMR